MQGFVKVDAISGSRCSQAAGWVDWATTGNDDHSDATFFRTARLRTRSGHSWRTRCEEANRTGRIEEDDAKDAKMVHPAKRDRQVQAPNLWSLVR